MSLEGRHTPEHISVGQETEWHCLGYGKNWNRILEEKNISPEKIRGFRNWIDVFKEHYPKKEAINPKTKWSTDLFDMVAEKLGLDIQEEKNQGLEFYNATDSPLDLMGVDAFFLFNDSKKEKIFTIDLTENPNKDEWKADLIINKIPIRENLTEEQYIDRMEDLAETIAQGIEQKPGATIH